MSTLPLATDCGACHHTLNWHNDHCQVPNCPCQKFTEPSTADSPAAQTTPARGAGRD
jgi:hypothetical protein